MNWSLVEHLRSFGANLEIRGFGSLYGILTTIGVYLRHKGTSVLDLRL